MLQSHTQDPLAGLLSDLGAVSRNTVYVEAERDPAYVGRTAYRITGQSFAAVQYAIERRMREAAERPGSNTAQFEHPRRTAEGYEALGEVIFGIVSPPLAPVLP